jgi:hypothetical protein
VLRKDAKITAVRVKNCQRGEQIPLPLFRDRPTGHAILFEMKTIISGVLSMSAVPPAPAPQSRYRNLRVLALFEDGW